MELREAREVIAHYRKIDEKVYLGPAVEAAIVLDDRITELEAQRDELVKALGGLKRAVEEETTKGRPSGHSGDVFCAIGMANAALKHAIERIARASDKEVKV